MSGEGHNIPESGLRGQRRLTALDISFSDEITQFDSLLNFYMDTYFNVDEVFGTHVCTGENDDTLNVYANYDMAAGQICDTLEVDMHWADGREEPLEYWLDASEKAILLQKMDAYCRQQTGQTLAEYSAQLMAEEAGAAPEEIPEADAPMLTM